MGGVLSLLFGFLQKNRPNRKRQFFAIAQFRFRDNVFAVRAEPTAPHAVQRLCTLLSQWTLSDDAALILLMGYLWHQASLGLVGKLGPEGLGRQEHRQLDRR